MKSRLMILLLAVVPLCRIYALQVNVDARAVSASKVVVMIETDSPQEARFSLPDVIGGKWISNQISSSLSTSRSVINGRAEEKTSRKYIIELQNLDGKTLTIPPFYVECNGEKVLTREVQVAPGEKTSLEKMLPQISAKINFDGRKVFYTGEEISAEFQLIYPENLQIISIEAPQMSGVGNDAVFRRFADQYGREHLFARSGNSREVIAGKNFRKLGLKAYFQLFKPGQYHIGALQKIEAAADAETENSMHDFFSFRSVFSRRSESLQVEYPPVMLEVKPLPPVPAGVAFLGLIGDWNIVAAVSPEKVKAGELVTLEIKGSGSGDISALAAPELILPGFRVFPPEIKKRAGQFVISYALIALETGVQTLKCDLAAFDPQKGEYRIYPVHKNIEIAAGSNTVQSQTTLPAPEKQTPSDDTEKLAVPLLKHISADVKLPLIRNQIFPIVMILVISAAVAAVLIGFCRRRAGDTSDDRKKCGAEIIRLLQDGSDENIQDKLPDLLRKLALLPPGCDINTVKDKIADSDIDMILDLCEKRSFTPGAQQIAIPAARRSAAVKAVKKLFLLFFIFLPLLSVGGENEYYSGNYQNAAGKFADQLKSGVSAGKFYNLGCARFMQKDFAGAKSAFMRAKSLAPRDQDISRMISRCNEALGIKNESSYLFAPYQICRPDEYLLIAVIMFSAVLILGTIAAVRQRRAIWILCVALLILTSLPLGFAITGAEYYNGRGVVVKENVQLRSLPDKNGKSVKMLPPGSEVEILDRRPGWDLVKSEGDYGWCEISAVDPVAVGSLW